MFKSRDFWDGYDFPLEVCFTHVLVAFDIRY